MNDLSFENNRTEYKRCLTDKFEFSIISFLNSRDGGTIYLGIDDDLTIYGIENPDIVQRQIADRIKSNIRGECLGLYDISTEKRNNKDIIRITISSGTEKPYYLRDRGMTPDGCFIRNGSRIEPMTSAMIEKLYSRRTRNSLSVLTAPNQDLTFEQLRIFYEERGKRLNEQFAKSLGFLTPDGRYNLNAFLFADENTTTIKVAKFDGNNKTKLIENEEYGYCSIIKSCKAVLDKLNVENRTLARITYPFRQETRLIDADSLREAVINAFVHNDYSDLMSPAFYIFADRLEIVSYGGLIDGMSKEELVSGCSRPRNREIMRIFKDVDLVEQLGTGMNRMMKAYTPDIFVVSPNFFHTVFSYNKLSDNFGKEFGKGFTKEPTERQRVILELLSTNPTFSAKAISEKISEKVPVSERTIENDLAALKKYGLLRRIGGRKGGHWEIILP